MKVTRFDESNLFDDLDKIDAWVAERGFTQRNRLRIYRENLIALRDSDDDMVKIHSQMKEAGRVNEILASYVEGFELSDALKCLLDNRVDIPDELLKRSLDGHADAAQETRVVEMPVTRSELKSGTLKGASERRDGKDSEPSSTKVLRFAANLLPSSKGGEPLNA
jgi:hypothetical protein